MITLTQYRKVAPCKNCQDRCIEPNCHDTCKKYKEWKQKSLEPKHKERYQRNLDNYEWSYKECGRKAHIKWHNS